MEPVKLTMRYCGKDVEDGTISLEDTVVALQGFSSAYSKVVQYKNIESQHQLRLTEIKKGSCDLLITVKELIADRALNIALGVAISNIFEILEIIGR